MNEYILENEVQDYITEHLNVDVLSLLFTKSPFPKVSIKELVEQIDAKTRIKKKLPTWFSTPNIYYANKLNISQTSSELTAKYKADIVNGKTLLDITGGFGVDSYAFSKKMQLVYHLEENKKLSEIARHNFKALKATNIKTIGRDGLKFLSNNDIDFDWIYIDPSRRTEKKEKVYFLSDCKPDVIKHLDLLFLKCKTILIKTGPLLDLEAGIRQLENIVEAHILGVENEVKEVLWVLQKDYSDSVLIKAVNLGKNNREDFTFYLHEEKQAISQYTNPEEYLYEPNTPILKSGAYRLLGERYGLKKISQHSHIYTSMEFKKFPGRSFKILETLLYNKKLIRSLGVAKANITTRNFPMSVAEIRKKTKLKDGGEVYLFFTRNKAEKLIIIKCRKINTASEGK